jgi:chemotaxis protein histidine kinase CheA
MEAASQPSSGMMNLTIAKEARKRAELDAQLLANRIALLKQEEEKAWKKIAETQKKSAEVVNLRTHNENKFSQKEQFYKAKWESIRSAQSQNAMEREKARANKEQMKSGLLAERQQNAITTKQQSQELLMKKKEREANERQEKQERSDYLKAKKLDGKRRLEEYRLQQIEKSRGDYEARHAQEQLLQSRTEMLVAKMEKEEMELIQRLQNTQAIQRNAYEELESALGQTGGGTMTPSQGRLSPVA